MKKILFSNILLFVACFSVNSQTIERIGIDGPLEFNGTKFHLAWSAKPNENYFVQEYLPLKETVEKFNQLITVNLFVIDVSVDDAVNQRVAQLTIRKETDKVCNFRVIKSPDGKESILDCILSSGTDEALDVVEFIIYRYKQIELENNKKALLVYSYSKRSYTNEIASFLKNLKNLRTDLIDEMANIELPTVKLKE